MNLKLVSVVAFIILVLAMVYLLLVHSLFGHGPVAITLQVGAVLLMLWARITFGRRSFHAGANPTAGGLVTSGPYRYLRHPIYVAILLFTLTGIVSNWNLASAIAGIVIIVAVFARMLCEETLLRVRYPEYSEYSRGAKRLFPFLY
jgi:protein-S-isoprenylcysteine O-methyltransferase Ste14